MTDRERLAIRIGSFLFELGQYVRGTIKLQPGREPGTDISAAGYGRHVVEVVQQVAIGETLDDAERDGRAADPPARQTEGAEIEPMSQFVQKFPPGLFRRVIGRFSRLPLPGECV